MTLKNNGPDTATSVTLRREKGEQDIILRKDIEEMAASSKSLMPDGLEKEISPFPDWLIWQALISPRLELFEASATRLGPEAWKAQCEHGAFPEPAAVRLDLTAQHLGQALGEGEANPEPARGSVERDFGLRKHVEDMGQHLRGDADARVLHPHHHLTRLLHHGEPDRACVLRELDCIREDVRDHLCQAHGIGEDHQGIFGHLHAQA